MKRLVSERTEAIHSIWKHLSIDEKEERNRADHNVPEFDFVPNAADQQLDALEKYLEHLRGVKEMHDKIVHLVDKRVSFREQLDDFDKKAQEMKTEHSFKDRNSFRQLRYEEKMRVMRNDGLPKLVKAIANRAKEYQAKTNRVFLWHSQPLLEILRQDAVEDKLKAEERRRIVQEERVKRRESNVHSLGGSMTPTANRRKTLGGRRGSRTPATTGPKSRRASRTQRTPAVPLFTDTSSMPSNTPVMRTPREATSSAASSAALRRSGASPAPSLAATASSKKKSRTPASVAATARQPAFGVSVFTADKDKADVISAIMDEGDRMDGKPSLVSSSPSLANQASVAYAQEDYKKALALYTEAIEKALPTDDLCHLYHERSKVHTRLRDFEAAMADTDTALALNEQPDTDATQSSNLSSI
jgi:tetratricopeptide (TPR) repeat protein